MHILCSVHSHYLPGQKKPPKRVEFTRFIKQRFPSVDIAPAS
nr:MAG TPA: hypothetical protein [Caudoviricetes sp.]